MFGFFFLPAAADRYFTDGEPRPQGGFGVYWSSTEDSPHGIVLWIRQAESLTGDRWPKAQGNTIRCVR